MGEERKEKFKTGGGPAPRSSRSVGSSAVSGVLEAQEPLSSIPDDGHMDSNKEEGV